jgi:hypothetical protein
MLVLCCTFSCRQVWSSVGNQYSRVSTPVLSGTFRVTLYSRRSTAHRAFVTKKHPLSPAGGQTRAADRPAGGWLPAGRIVMTPYRLEIPYSSLESDTESSYRIKCFPLVALRSTFFPPLNLLLLVNFMIRGTVNG